MNFIRLIVKIVFFRDFNIHKKQEKALGYKNSHDNSYMKRVYQNGIMSNSKTKDAKIIHICSCCNGSAAPDLFQRLFK